MPRVESLFFVRQIFDQGSVTCASGCTNPVLNIFTVSAHSNSCYYMAEIQTEMVENVAVCITKYIFVCQCATPVHFPIILRQNGANLWIFHAEDLWRNLQTFHPGVMLVFSDIFCNIVHGKFKKNHLLATFLTMPSIMAVINKLLGISWGFTLLQFYCKIIILASLIQGNAC
jgi:hypothetical protein